MESAERDAFETHDLLCRTHLDVFRSRSDDGDGCTLSTVVAAI